jgi:DNA-binding beta-propeller fold protein YncE
MRNLVAVLVLCATALQAAAAQAGPTVLPNGRRLTPAGRQLRVGGYPQTIVRSPDGTHVLTVDTGAGPQTLDWIDTSTLAVQPVVPEYSRNTPPSDEFAAFSLFTGATFSADGSRLYVSAGNQGAVLVFDVTPAGLVQDSGATIALPDAGLVGPVALSPDGSTLYTVDASRTSRAVYSVELATGAVHSTTLGSDRPYAMLVAGDRVYVAGMSTGNLYELDAGLHLQRTVQVGIQPMSIAAAGDQLLVADANGDAVVVVDAASLAVVQRLDLQMLPGGFGSSPNAISVDGNRAAVTLGGLNALAILDRRHGTWHRKGAVPTGWTPESVTLDGNVAWVANARGEDSWLPYTTTQNIGPSAILGFAGTVSRIDLDTDLRAGARQVLDNARIEQPSPTTMLSPQGPIKHVVFILRENKTFDADLGDTPGGDPRFVLFPRQNTPSLHAMADRFAVLDNFYANAEASDEGHEWAAGGYVTDYVDRFWNAHGGGDTRIWSSSSSGADPIDYPSGGYIFDAAERAGITWRNFGEFMRKSSRGGPFRDELAPHRNPDYPGWDQAIPDTEREKIWQKEFDSTEMPAFSFVYLPNDHGFAVDDRQNPTLQQQVADNDRATGLIVDAISHSRYWGSTAIFITEDDPQSALDHISSHRTVGMVISPWAKRGTVDVHADTASMVQTVEMILGLEPTNQFDANARPLAEAFTNTPDLTPFDAPAAGVPMTPPPPGALARARALGRTGDHRGPDRVSPAKQLDFTYLSVHGLTYKQFLRRVGGAPGVGDLVADDD